MIFWFIFQIFNYRFDKMIVKAFLLFLIQYNYRSLSAFENRLCDNSYKDSLLSLGGIFSIDDTLFATRRYPNSNQSIVWKFKLKVIDTKTNLKDNKFEIIDMSSHEMKSLFPGLKFDYFVSGFSITDTIPCNDKSQECANASLMKNLTVILGPNKSYSRQPYAVYRFNGVAFTAVDPKTDTIPLGLSDRGTTTYWFSPKAFITTTFRHKEKQIIGYNYGDKTVNKLQLKTSVHKIGNRYWDILVSNISIDSFSYHLIELKVTETQRKVLLITQQMVYQLIGDKKLEEVMHPWNLFGCKSVKISLRSETKEEVPKFNKKGAKVDKYENLTIKLAIQMTLANLFYIAIIALISVITYLI